MKKVLFLLLPIFLFGDISSSDLFACKQHDYDMCHEIGMRYLSKMDSNYNPEKAVYPLKMSCQYGSNPKSCFALASYYRSIKDYANSKDYLKFGCNLNDEYSCYLYNSSGR